MTDLLQAGALWLTDKLHAHAAHEVSYRRGLQQVPVTATIGKTIFETTNEFGVVERIESRDFLIRAEDLVLDGVPALPERGDRITETIGTQTFVYEVLAPGREPAWRYSDAFRTLLRIHTKFIGME